MLNAGSPARFHLFFGLIGGLRNIFKRWWLISRPCMGSFDSDARLVQGGVSLVSAIGQYASAYDQSDASRGDCHCTTHFRKAGGTTPMAR